LDEGISPYQFRGIERATIEIEGTFDATQSFSAPVDLEIDENDRVRVSVFAFHVDDLQITGVPLVRASYGELLWRIAIRDRGEPAWWVIACDLEPLGARLIAERTVRYPVRRNAVDVTVQAVRAPGFVVELEAATSARPIEHRRMVVRDGWEVPWGDDDANAGVAPMTVVDDTLAFETVGTRVKWSPTALVRTNREHRCGIATLRR
jgi:hypothetical protein